MQNIYGYRLSHGILWVYGDNIKKCKPYIDDAVNSVEDVCIYCSRHELRIFYKQKHVIRGILESLRVRRLTEKYSVNSSKRMFLNYTEQFTE